MRRAALPYDAEAITPEITELVSALVELSECTGQDVTTTVEELERLVRKQVAVQRLRERLGSKLALDLR